MKQLVLQALCFSLGCVVAKASDMNRTGTMYAPYIEWSVPNPSYSGNPFDLRATATFSHAETGETRTTGFFFAKKNLN